MNHLLSVSLFFYLVTLGVSVIIVIIYCSVYQLFTSTLHCDPMQDVRGMILDISKAFDKVWHEGLLYNLET